MDTNRTKDYVIDAHLFAQHLISETHLLNKWFNKQYFKSQGLNAGTEIEFLILDKNYHLLPKNISFVNELHEPGLVPEAGIAQLEINTQALPLTENYFSLLHKNILNLWEKCRRVAQEHQYHLALIGSMPQIEKNYSKTSCITPYPEFHLMNECSRKYRKGLPLSIHLQGNDTLTLHPESLAIEGLICSLQLHLEVSQSQSTHYYNLIQMLSAPLLALCSNAPFFYGKNLWSESRIGVFEQLYHFPAPVQRTVFFEPRYLKNSFFSIFQYNAEKYPYLIPEVADETPDCAMFHVRRQNSSIFRWNRPILDFAQDETPYLRIEHRALSTGPTVVDMVANAAFFYGIINYFAQHPGPLLPLRHSLFNFYEAARFGLNASLQWNNRKIKAHVLLKHLVPLAHIGLQELGISPTDANFYLKIIEKRLLNNQNGSIWQQKYVVRHGKEFTAMLEQYIQNQYSEIPVSEWPV